MSYMDNFDYIFNKHSINNSFNFDKEISQKVWKFFKEVMPKLGYEEREGQEDMAPDILDAIRDNEHLMIEAGEGMGKSYGYLVPLVYYNNLTK